jgi:nucleoid-associated protein YgaU
MQRTDLETPALTAFSLAASRCSRLRSMCFPAILISTSAIFGAAQCSAQDVAEAARQERTQKQSKHKRSKHVYTGQDLKRAQILTPEDRAQVEAKKNQAAPLPAEKSGDAVDAQSLPADAPLGDVARRFRKQKESQKLQRSAEFHLPFTDGPALASPKPPVMPLRPPVSNPALPKFVPYQPPVKRSPFERPRVFVAPPSIPLSRPPAARIGPLQPAAPVPVAPAAPIVPVVPSSTAKLNAVIVKPGDSLWKIAEQNLGKGTRWQELFSVNPAIRDANQIKAGSQIFLPAVSSVRTGTKITVKKGDTLTSIAQAHFGHASCWSSIVQANPAIRDANLIFEGQVLLVPAACRP